MTEEQQRLDEETRSIRKVVAVLAQLGILLIVSLVLGVLISTFNPHYR